MSLKYDLYHNLIKRAMEIKEKRSEFSERLT
jgi:hypothetical protein